MGSRLSLQKRLSALFTFSALFSSLFYISNAIATPLSWQDCLNQTVQGNTDLTAAQSTLQANTYQARGAYSGFLPQISGNVSYSYSGSNDTTFGSTISNGATVIAPTQSANTSYYSTGLTATESLFSGLSDKAKVDSAQATQEGSEANLVGVKAQVSSNLKTAFAALLYAQASIDLDKAIVEHRDASYRMIELHFESGTENKGSMLLSKANVEQAKYNLLQAEDNLITAKAQLAQVLGIEDSENLSVSGTVPVMDPPQNIDFKAASLGVPDYLQAIATEKGADASLVSARSAFFPTLSLNGSLSNTGDEWYPSSHRWSVGAGITFPFFAGGKDYYATKSAAQNLKAADATLASTHRADLFKLKNAYTNYIEAVRLVEVDKLFADATTIREKISAQKYNNGLMTFDDLDIIETDYINRQTNLLSAQQNRVVQEAAWELAQGKGAIP